MTIPNEFEIKAALEELVHDGLLECIGVDADGEALYQLTEKGRAIELEGIDDGDA